MVGHIYEQCILQFKTMFILALLSHSALFMHSDLPFMEGLFDILALVSDDNQARNALWCILPCLLAQAQQIDMNSSSLEQFVSLLLGRFTHIKDDLESHRVDKKEELTAEDAYLKHGVSASVSFLPIEITCFVFSWKNHNGFMEMWKYLFTFSNLTRQTWRTILEQHHIAFPILKIINSSGRSAVSWRGGSWRSPPWAKTKTTPHRLKAPLKMLDIFWTTARIMTCSLLTATLVDIADLWVCGCNPRLPNRRKSFKY